ncbi:DUF480 domain-containing protein [Nocardioides sp. MAH-18]|uniref:DUF480 domain-containing protein n=1 Tax=Nocardioides agri TaxID=2682843 RepID=A0A6L6XXC9_9ACTN|nr:MULTISPECIES: DUF480 domain-containing protein [unclassified Nocardioides]MBA2952576.1 DUF480 domain-containing protein [Nocardioides sp. CGMCC 1.13656]MVQ51738.1 DUF480 domain-containing protein [Nocardioides sp. MAH-18]
MADLPVLDPEEQRVLGSLLEKQRTVPDSYPLSLNALRTACNQSSSRDPVVSYDEQTVEQVGRRLKDRGLLRIVWAATGRRTLKYHQALDEVVDLADDERALLTVLLLRGPQAPGELRTRTERMHTFADREETEQALVRMAERGLVRELPRRGGERDNRWIHLLGAEAAPEPPAPAVDILAEGGAARDERVRAAYDAVAATYSETLFNELTGLPFESWLLDRVAAYADGGPVVEVGCGPGHVTAYLAEAGADATGIDLSPAMVDEARRRYPDGSYEVGDLRRLMRPTSAPGWSAVLAWYSLIHLAASELAPAVEALSRPLDRGGWLVLALHAGSEVRHVDAWFDHEVDLDFMLHEPADVVALVRAAGLVDVEWYRRGPVEHRDETTDRLYVVARKPS